MREEARSITPRWGLVSVLFVILSAAGTSVYPVAGLLAFLISLTLFWLSYGAACRGLAVTQGGEFGYDAFLAAVLFFQFQSGAIPYEWVPISTDLFRAVLPGMIALTLARLVWLYFSLFRRGQSPAA